MHDIGASVDLKVLSITSRAFDNNGNIPAVYTCDGVIINPPLDIDQIPINTKSLVIVVKDTDAPGGN
jgi:phosphatidylethanolamine-binding protein (PEBP) family uncharacterized protein